MPFGLFGKKAPKESKFPPGVTFFGQLKHNFGEIQLGDAPDYKIPTGPFIDAARSFQTLFDVISMPSLRIVVTDMKKNTDKIANTLREYPLESLTLQDLIEAEKKRRPEGGKEVPGGSGIFWLLKTLEFISKSIVAMLDEQPAAAANGEPLPKPSLAESLAKVYPETLESYHGPWESKGFAQLFAIAGSRDNILPYLADDEGKLAADAFKWRDGLDKIVKNPNIIHWVEQDVGKYIKVYNQKPEKNFQSKNKE